MCVSLPSLKDRQKCERAIVMSGRRLSLRGAKEKAVHRLAAPAVAADRKCMHRRCMHTSPGRPCAETLEPRRLLAVDVNIDAATRFQQIDGFGTSIAWWRNNVVEQEAWRNAYFQDLGSSMLRVDLNILALPGSDGDLATPVTMVADLQTNINAFNWNSVPTQRFGGVIRSAAAKTIDDFKLIGTVWTPPHWMKSQELTSTGEPKV